MKKYFVASLFALFTIQLSAQKIKVENKYSRIENYPRIIFPDDLKSYRVKISNYSKSKEVSNIYLGQYEKLFKLNSLNLVKDFADITIEFFIYDEIIENTTYDKGLATIYYKMNNKIKVYTKSGDYLYDGSVTDFYLSSSKSYTRAGTIAQGSQRNVESNLYKECTIAGEGIRAIFEFTYTANFLTFMRIKGDENYEKILDKAITFVHRDTMFTRYKNPKDSLNYYINELVKLKKEDESIEYNKKHNTTINSNLAVLYALSENFEKADECLNAVDEEIVRDNAFSRQKELIKKRKIDFKDYKLCMEQYNSGNYNPYVNRK